MDKKRTTKKGKAPTVSAKSKRAKKALKVIGAEMSAVLNADAFRVRIPKIKNVRRTKVAKVIAAMRIAEPIAPAQDAVEQIVAIPDVIVLHAAAGKMHASVVETKKTASKADAHTPLTQARTVSPAARRGLDCVRYIKIHLRRPYGPRGQQAIAKIAREAAHLANLELDAATNTN